MIMWPHKSVPFLLWKMGYFIDSVSPEVVLRVRRLCQIATAFQMPGW